jgi:hypothetical protein
MVAKLRRTAMCDPPPALPRPMLAAPQRHCGRLHWPARFLPRFHSSTLPRFNGSTLPRFTDSDCAFAPLRLCVNSVAPALKPRLLRVARLALAFGLSPGSPLPGTQAQEPPTNYVNVANANPVFPYTSWATAATTIQDAVNAGTTIGRLVLVTDGVYQTGTDEADGTSRVALTNVVLRSVNGPNVTTIDGANTVRCVYLGEDATLSGFTLWNGSGGGVVALASGVVTNCVFTGNSDAGASGGTLYNCTLSGNSGAGVSGATLYNCRVTGNAGSGASDSTLYSCTLTGNSGGGANGGTLYNCIA